MAVTSNVPTNRYYGEARDREHVGNVNHRDDDTYRYGRKRSRKGLLWIALGTLGALVGLAAIGSDRTGQEQLSELPADVVEVNKPLDQLLSTNVVKIAGHPGAGSQHAGAAQQGSAPGEQAAVVNEQGASEQAAGAVTTEGNTESAPAGTPYDALRSTPSEGPTQPMGNESGDALPNPYEESITTTPTTPE